jgi:hypothetical protein
MRLSSIMLLALSRPDPAVAASIDHAQVGMPFG